MRGGEWDERRGGEGGVRGRDERKGGWGRM